MNGHLRCGYFGLKVSFFSEVLSTQAVEVAQEEVPGNVDVQPLGGQLAKVP